MESDDFLPRLREIEKKWQKKWEAADLFVGKIDKNTPKWFITVPYPYTSGPMHIGHCRTYNLGDIFARFKRQKGYNVLWPMAFHLTGTPILAISSRIQSKEPEILELYSKYIGIYESDKSKIKAILETFKEPINVASYFADKLLKDFKRMGFSIDETRRFTTAEPLYVKFIEWQYKILNDKKLIVQGNLPILWCDSCKNAVGEDDINAGDEEKVEVSQFTGIKFKLPSGKFLFASTLRPETIFAATNVWINPDTIYYEISFNGEIWIVSKEASLKLRLQNHEIQVQHEISGKELIGLNVEIPLIKNKIPVLPGYFLDSDHASGVVYSVPAHAPYDYIALRDLQQNNKQIIQFGLDTDQIKSITPISLIEVKGHGEFPAVELCNNLGISSIQDVEKLEQATQTLYKSEFYSGIMKENANEFRGMRVESAKDAVENKLKDANLALDFFEVSRKAFCRCGSKITAAIISDQYFLNYGNEGWKVKAFSALNSMEIIPEKYRLLFENTFNWLDKRPCVRKRGLGTEFPFTKGKGWIIESLSDSVIYMAFYTIIKQIRDGKISPGSLLPEVFDYIFLNKGKIQKVAQQSNIQADRLKLMKDEFQYWYPNDLRHTAISHISNHLSFAIFHHAAIFPKKHWIKAISLNDMLIREGQKMGKSKGNVIPMAQIPERYKYDLARLHLASIATPDSIIDWRDNEVSYSLKKIKKFWDYACSIKNCENSTPKTSIYSKTLISAVKSNNKSAIGDMENLNIREYIQKGFFKNIQEIDDYEKMIPHDMKKERDIVIKKVISDMSVIMAPIIPHICEEINFMFGNLDFASVSPIPTINLTEEDKKLALKSSFLSKMVDDIEQIIELTKKIPKKIIIYVNPEWKNVIYLEARKIFRNEAFNLSKFLKHINMVDELKPHMKKIAQEAKFFSKNPIVFRISMLDPDEQISAIEDFKEIIQAKFGNANIEIYKSESVEIFDPSNKAFKARPMKPAIYVE